jgi:hypothetical protein
MVAGVATYAVGQAKFPVACGTDVKLAESQLPNGLATRSQCPPGSSYERSDKAYVAVQTWQTGLSLTIIGAILVVSGLSWHFLESGATRVSVSFDRGMGVAVNSKF